MPTSTVLLTVATTTMATAVTTIAPVTNRAEPTLARSRGMTSAPATAPIPTMPSSSPYPVEPRCRFPAATTGSSAQIALAAGMKRIARYSNRRTINACRTYRPPAHSASTSRSRGPPSARTGARQLATTAAIATNDTALRAKTQPAPTAATTKPPTAGPTARATFMFSPFNAAACGRSSRSTRSGCIACQAGLATALPQPKAKVSPNTNAGEAAPTKVAAANADAARNIAS